MATNVTTQDAMCPSTIIPVNKKSHLVVVYNKTTNNIKYYLNGNLIGNYASAFYSIPPTLNTIKCIGNLTYNSTAGFFNGKIYCLRVYNRGLTDAEIKRNYYASR
jgi:hypothetical protein